MSRQAAPSPCALCRSPSPARTPPLQGRRHPPRQDGCLGVQGVHLRHALPEAVLGRVRGREEVVAEKRARAAARWKPSSAETRRYYGQSFFVPPRLAGALRRRASPQRRRLPQQGPGWPGEENTSLEGCCSTSTSTARSASRRSPTSKLRQLISHFNTLPAAQRGLRVSRPARRRLRVPDRRVRRLGRQEGRRVLHAALGRAHDGAARQAQGAARIYDPCVGSGGMLILARNTSTSTAARAQLGPLRPGGQRRVWSISKMNMMLHGIADADLRNGDTLAEPSTSRAAS
jgi:type I restriction enzyme M protein